MRAVTGIVLAIGLLVTGCAGARERRANPAATCGIAAAAAEPVPQLAGDESVETRFRFTSMP